VPFDHLGGYGVAGERECKKVDRAFGLPDALDNDALDVVVRRKVGVDVGVVDSDVVFFPTDSKGLASFRLPKILLSNISLNSARYMAASSGDSMRTALLLFL